MQKEFILLVTFIKTKKTTIKDTEYLFIPISNLGATLLGRGSQGLKRISLPSG